MKKNDLVFKVFLAVATELLIIFCLLCLIACADSFTTNEKSGDDSPNGGPYKTGSSSVVFNQYNVANYKLTVAEDDWDYLIGDPLREEYVPAMLVVGEDNVGKVGLRFKGEVGSLAECVDENKNIICRKLSMKIKFNKYDKKKRFYGLKRLNFHSSINAPSLMNERLAYGIFNEMGIETSRTAYATLEINGESRGLFVLVEQIDGRFTDRVFDGGGNGNLYKSTWPYSSDPWDYEWGLKTNEDEQDHTQIINFYNELSTASDEELPDIIAKYWDVEHVMRYFMTNDAVANWDGPTAWWCGDWCEGDGLCCSNGNFYIYQEETAPKFWFLAWDQDAAFNLDSLFDEAGVPKWYEVTDNCSMYLVYDAGTGNPDDNGYAIAPGCDRFMQGLRMIKNHEGEYKGLYDTAARQLLDGPFQLSAINAKIDAWKAQIDSIVKEDTCGPSYGEWLAAVAELRDAAATLRTRLEASIAPEVTSVQ